MSKKNGKTGGRFLKREILENFRNIRLANFKRRPFLIFAMSMWGRRDSRAICGVCQSILPTGPRLALQEMFHGEGMVQTCSEQCYDDMIESSVICEKCDDHVWEGEAIILADATYCGDCVPRCSICDTPCIEDRCEDRCDDCRLEEGMMRCRAVAIALICVKRTKQGRQSLGHWDRFLLGLIAQHVYATCTDEKWQ